MSAAPDSIEMTPVAGPVNGSIRPPGSKSITNRALICAALADGASTLTGALESEDTHVMIAALQQLGIAVEVSDHGRTLRVAGCGGKIPAKSAELFIANSGTSMRFLTAMATIGHGAYKLDGIARMRERPIGDLVSSLRQLGVQIEALGANECPPVAVTASGLPGGEASIRGDVSSQFLSGLLMAAPYAQQPITLKVSGTLVSIPYVDMTIKVMESFGAAATATSDYAKISVSNGQQYRGIEYAIEPDASAASYYFALAAITGGRITVENLSRASLQGDVEFCDCLAQMGASVEYGPDSITVQGGKLHGIDVDMNGISDTVQTLSVVALFADGPTRMRNVAHIRHKETDRIGATACELRKLGATVDETEDGLTVHPGTLRGAAIDTYNDHRMAMSFALAGLRTPGVVIRNPGCTSKTYPEFFEDLARLIRGA
ncbi:3-phosphoshikimate 1-carboxyvinyltransferase [Lacipirellula parvula]|uniref:3-phosphoshikimate 1-carboxyvinyltransferase n=1 Tax=Lacipirellula parvula TaxID=2650471 RepID=A0A5K7XGY2_9BACT|nr:3-phosphoshikimate 1-carboxyvinyltransferase [Lacipirellula parvula]BBO33493.1 3-phosphoshikimate 1-carboxyvinyltransferase [Lacipirellula parvula]